MVGAAVLAAGLAVPPAAAASADVVRDALVFDVVNPGTQYSPSAAHARYDSTGSAAPVAGPSSVPGSVRLARPATASSGPGIELLPADGARLAVGTYTGIPGQWGGGARPTPVLRLLSGLGDCSDFTWGAAGRLVVHEVTHDDAGAVLSLSASWQMPCQSWGATATGEIRYRSAAGYASAASTRAYLDTIVAGSRTPFTATVVNTGTAPLSLGAPTAVDRGTGAPRIEVAPGSASCSDEPLAVGARCTLSLVHVDSGTAGGGHVGELRLAAPALVRGHVTVLSEVREVVFPPAPPRSVATTGAYDGVAVHWTRDFEGRPPDGWKVRRVDGPQPVLLASVPWDVETWADTTLAKGASATYEVSAYNLAGEAPAAPVTGTRLDLPDPPAALDRRTLVMDGVAGSAVADTATGGRLDVETVFASSTRLLSPAVSLSLPRHLRAGTFGVGYGPGQLVVSASGPSAQCSSPTGTVEVREAWVRADGSVHRLEADLHLRCGDVPVEMAVRLGTGGPFTAVTSPRSVEDLAGTVGEPPARRAVPVTNAGTGAVEVGAASLSGFDAAVFTVDPGDCGGLLQPAATCTLEVVFAPQRAGRHQALLTLALGTAIGSRQIPLSAEAVGPPPPMAVDVTATLGQVLVRWYYGSDGGSPITGFRVQRALADGPFTDVAEVPAGTYDWVDDVTPGRSYRYRLVSINRYGAGLPGEERSSGVVPSEELLASVGVPGSTGADLASLRVGAGAPLPLGTGQDTDLPAVSPDGRTAAYVVHDAEGDAGLWLRSLTGAPAARVLVDAADVDEADPAWSPDGSTVCFSRSTGTDDSVWCTGTDEPSTPAPLRGGADAVEPSWLPDGSGLVVTDLSGTGLRLARITTAGTRTVLPGTDGGSWPAVSPRGDRIAFVTTDAYRTSQVRTVPVAGGTRTELATSTDVEYDRPSWAPDGQALAVPGFGRWNAPDVTVWRAAQGTTPATVEVHRAAAGYDVTAVAWRRLDVAAPTITFPQAPARTAAAARVPVAVADDTVPVGGLTVSCAVDGTPVGRCAAGWTGTLAAGPHTLAVTATDPHGRTATATHTWTVDTVAPTPLVSALPSFSLTGQVRVVYAAKGGDVASYDVRQRRASWSDAGFSAPTSPAGWSGTRSWSKVLSLTPGQEVCVSVRARDDVGNVSAWSAERCTAMPLDDRQLARATPGWTSTTAPTAYAGTLTRTTTGGARLVRTGVRASRLALVVTTCPTCGSVDVLVGGTRIGTVRLTSTTTQTRQVRELPVQPSVLSGAVTVRSTTSGRPVVVDGLGLRRG